MLTITRRFTFDAAHCLERHKGKCSRYHGHTYILEVTVGGSFLLSDTWEDQGFFLDLGDLKRIVGNELNGKWDHYDLNRTIDSYPTAERLIHKLWATLYQEFKAVGCQLVHLRLHETPNSWVEYNGEDPVFDHRVEKYQEAQQQLRPTTPLKKGPVD
jgi:6-pyruvoyltetrahydropterin/6-carboxytetrahydropterin synthase